MSSWQYISIFCWVLSHFLFHPTWDLPVKYILTFRNFWGCNHKGTLIREETDLLKFHVGLVEVLSFFFFGWWLFSFLVDGFSLVLKIYGKKEKVSNKRFQEVFLQMVKNYEILSENASISSISLPSFWDPTSCTIFRILCLLNFSKCVHLLSKWD